MSARARDLWVFATGQSRPHIAERERAVMKRQRSIVALEQVPLDQRDLVKNCFFCYCPKHPTKRQAVAAVTDEGLNHFYGICGFHAEVYPFTEEEEQKRPMVCPY